MATYLTHLQNAGVFVIKAVHLIFAEISRKCFRCFNALEFSIILSGIFGILVLYKLCSRNTSAQSVLDMNHAIVAKCIKMLQFGSNNSVSRTETDTLF